MAFNIIRDDIVNVEADAIVNTANPNVYVGKGVDAAIYEAAGYEDLIAERARIGVMEPGQAAATPAFKLKAKYILHTVSPVWHGGRSGEREALRSCYRNTLDLAEELECESVAFPFLATGNDHFPRDEAIRIATEEINGFLLEHDLDVILAIYDNASFTVSSKLFSDIDEYIEAHQAIPDLDTPYDSAEAAFGGGSFRRNAPAEYRGMPPVAAGSALPRVEELAEIQTLEEEAADEAPAIEEELADETPATAKALVEEAQRTIEGPAASRKLQTLKKVAAPDTLDERLKNLDMTFQEYLFALIDNAGYKDSYVYKRANLTKQTFSKIRSDREYHPSKSTACALALALQLNLDETLDLLKRAGYTLSNSSLFDVIIQFCIEKKEYNIVMVNLYLAEQNQELLGSQPKDSVA